MCVECRKVLLCGKQQKLWNIMIYVSDYLYNARLTPSDCLTDLRSVIMS